MALAVCLLFDQRGDLLMRELWARLEKEGIRTLQTHTHGRHRPHLSYSVLLEWDLERVRAALDALPDGGPFAMSFHGSVVFPRGRAAMAPAIPADVAARQEAVTRALLETGAVVHKHYLPGHWVPHVSLATRATASFLPAVVTAVADVLPMEMRIERAALIDSATGESWTLPTIP